MKNNNSFSIIALGISVLSLLFIAYVVCLETRFNADWYAIVVGILALLVTVLIGWSIYTVIDFDRRVTKRINKAITDLNIEIKGNIKKESNKIIHITFGLIGLSMYQSGEIITAIEFYTRAIKYADNKEDIVDIEMYLDILSSCIDIVMKNEGRYLIKEDNKNAAYNTVRLIDNPKAEAILEKIKSLPSY